MSWLFPWSCRVATPLGTLVVAGQAAVEVTRFEERAEPGGDDPLGVRGALDAWFGGQLDALDRVSIAPEGTPYQRRVWDAVRAIPPGETRTYGELAKALGSVARAVGGANASNPIALFVPCHRVVGGRGALVGYAHGIERKAWLLAHERGEGALLSAPLRSGRVSEQR